MTRGSFYHHFEDHESFLLAITNRWFQRQTTRVAETIGRLDDAAARNAALTEAAMGIDYRLELGIRELARRIPAVNSVTQKADRVRLELVADIYAKLFGIGSKTAHDFAYLEYAAFSGIILLDPDTDGARQRFLAQLYQTAISRAIVGEPPR